MATKKYICAFCARAFTRSEHKQRHERSHTNEKPFHCLHCTSSFVRRDLLQRHCRTVHNFQLNSAQIQQGQQPRQEAQPLAYEDEKRPSGEELSRSKSSDSDGTSKPELAASIPLPSLVPSISSTAMDSSQSQPGPPRKRKKSMEDSKSDVLANHDLIHLLSVTRKLETILTSYDASNFDFNLNDHFLIGYVTLLSSVHEYKIFDRLLKDLFNYLNAYNVNSTTASRSQNMEMEPYGGKNTVGSKKKNQPNNFKIGLIYAIVSLGYICNDKHNNAIKFFFKSWNLLIKKLIPNYNNNNHVLDQIEILNNLFLLSYIYLEFDFGKFDSEEFEEEGTFINDEIILNYLNDISFIILSNLNTMSSSNDNIIDANLSMFWNIYILLSTYLKKEPPKFYSFFINRKVILDEDREVSPSPDDLEFPDQTKNESDNSLTLSSVMLKLSKSFISLNQPQSETDAKFLNTVIIATLFNELKSFINGDSFLIYTSRNYLHNAIILINKSINVHNTLTNNAVASTINSNGSSLNEAITDSEILLLSGRAQNVSNDSKQERSIKLFELFKKNVIINSPLKFHELLNNYLFVPSHFYNWELLTITLQEININFPINQFFLEYMSSSNPQLLNLNSNLTNYFNHKHNPIEINNNLSIISFPIVFFTKYLSLDIVRLSSYNVLQLNFINVFIIEWYMIMHKVIIMIWNNPDLFDENYILQNLVYLLLDNKKALAKKLNLEKPPVTNATNSPTNTSDEEFSFNQKWFWILKLKFDSIFETWMNLIKNEITNKCKIDNAQGNGAFANNYPATANCASNVHRYSLNNLSLLKVNVNKYINELVQREMSKFQNDVDRYQGNMASNGPTYAPNLGTMSGTTSVVAQAPVNPMVPNNMANNAMYLNYSNSYNVLNNDFDHMIGNNNYRRANSITLGVLASANNAELINGGSTISPVISNSSSVSNSSNPSAMRNSINYANGPNMKVNYNPPPPVLSSNGIGSSSGPSNVEIPVLPPILGGKNYSTGYGSNEYTSNDMRIHEHDKIKDTDGVNEMKQLIPNGIRKD